MKKMLVLVLAVMMAAMCFTACGDDTTTTDSTKKTDTNTTADTSADEEEEDLGFSEVEIFSGVEKEFLNLNGVYFQPVDMTGGYKAEDYDCHLELDVSCLASGKDYGFGEGDWVPYLTVEYTVKKNDSDYEVSGTFMPMAASDGPHYGANLKMDGDGEYTVTFTIKFPGSDTYLIHTDATGPDAHEYPAAIEYTYDKWQYVSGAWNE